MNKKIILLIAVILCVAVAAGGCSFLKADTDFNFTPNDELGLSEAVAAENIGSVARVQSSSFKGGYSYGTAFVVSGSGYLITNAHVVTSELAGSFIESNNVRLAFAGDDEYKTKCSIVDYNVELDLAVLKIDSALTGFKPVVFADSKLLNFGEAAVMIGNPENVGITVSNAIIGNPLVGIGKHTEYIQVTTNVNHGNSGGPLFNDTLGVVGVITLRYESDINCVQGIGYAIPSSTLLDYMKGVNKELKELAVYAPVAD